MGSHPVFSWERARSRCIFARAAVNKNAWRYCEKWC
jgi:hypothetical protein